MLCGKSTIVPSSGYKIKSCGGIRLFSAVFLFFFCVSARSQNTYAPVGGYSDHLIDRLDILYNDTLTNLHTSVRPCLRSDIESLNAKLSPQNVHGVSDLYNDAWLTEDNTEFFSDTAIANSSLHHNRWLYKTPANLFEVRKKDFYVFMNPVIHVEVGSSSDSAGLRFMNTRGVELRGGIDGKVGFYLYATDNQARYPEYVNERIIATPGVVPGDGLAKPFKENGYDFPVTHGYIGFNVTKHIAVQFGQDKIFVGNGIRSMIWSDNAKDFLFLKLNTKVWRFNYENIFAELIDYEADNIYNTSMNRKYAALHHLDINITPHLNIGAFETVIFNGTDTSGNTKGFELYYLNPVIFYRAVETGLGSTDNVVIGLDGKWNFLQHFSLYGQFVLDEFLFDQLFANNGWWGNKYAAQIGLKYFDVFNISHLDMQIEHNFARPYTYSHSDNGSSYTHYAEPLAHPLGANLSETIFSEWYQPIPKIVVEDRLFLSAYGADTSGSDWGQNVFLDYNLHEQEFGNTTTQGVYTSLMLNDLTISYQFMHNMFADFRLVTRNLNSDIDASDRKETYFAVGIRINDVLRNFDF